MLKFRFVLSCLLVSILISIVPFAVQAQNFETQASHAIIVDVGSRTTLFDKRAQERMKPASMAKILTLTIIFDALRRNQITLEDTVKISEDAWRRGGAPARGSTMFAELGSNVSVENLIRGIAVHSANDACIAIAEKLSGGEEFFARKMNEYGREIGMKNSNFKNATGLPDPDQYTTAQDLAVLTLHVLDKYPELYAYFSIPEFTWNDIRQFNRNLLLRQDIGVDGVKTGFTKESGFGMVASAVRDGRRLLLVVNGLDKKKTREEEVRKALDWGFESFQTVNLFEAQEVLGTAKVFGGTQGRVDVVADQPVAVLLPKGEHGQIRAQIRYRGPLRAPVKAGEAVGTLVVTVDGTKRRTQTVYTDEDVPEGNLQQRALDAIYWLALGWIDL